MPPQGVRHVPAAISVGRRWGWWKVEGKRSRVCNLRRRRSSRSHGRLEVTAPLSSAWGLLDGGTTIRVVKGVIFLL